MSILFRFVVFFFEKMKCKIKRKKKSKLLIESFFSLPLSLSQLEERIEILSKAVLVLTPPGGASPNKTQLSSPQNKQVQT